MRDHRFTFGVLVGAGGLLAFLIGFGLYMDYLDARDSGGQPYV